MVVHIDGASSSYGDILSVAVAATAAPIAPTAVQIFSPSSAVIVPPATTSSTMSSTTTTTTAAETDCVDAPDWTDAYGQSCAYYANDDGGYDRCAVWGRLPGGTSGPYGGAAVDDCCACGGGRRGDGGDTSSSGSGVIATTATTAAEEEGGDIDDAAMAAAGTCGNGERGDGICANGKCCSEVR